KHVRNSPSVAHQLDLSVFGLRRRPAGNGGTGEHGDHETEAAEIHDWILGSNQTMGTRTKRKRTGCSPRSPMRAACDGARNLFRCLTRRGRTEVRAPSTNNMGMHGGRWEVVRVIEH